jgi:hypothetical protein
MVTVLHKVVLQFQPMLPVGDRSRLVECRADAAMRRLMWRLGIQALEEKFSGW